jgi:glycosyltransferase 2 family protein
LFSSQKSGDQISRQTDGKHHWSWLITLLKIGLSVFAFAIVAFSVDLSAAWERAANQSIPYVILSAAILSVQLLLGGLRWHAILARLGANPSLRDSVRLYYISAFFNAYLWGAVGGDMLRAWLTYRRQLSAKIAVNSVVLDRIAAIAGLALLVLATAPVFFARVGNTLPMYIPLGLACAGLAGIIVAANLRRMPAAWLRSRLARYLQSLGGSIQQIFLTPKAALPVLGFAITAQIALGVATFSMAASLGIKVSMLDCIVLMQPVALVANLPISVGGWGVRETAVVLLFGLIGVPSSAALVLSLQLGLLALLVVLPGGILWLLLQIKERAPSPPA